MEQPLLFENLDTPSYKAFIDYHKANPKIYEFFRRYALKAIEKGHKKLSAEFLVNVIRWETPIKAGDDDFKINNNYKAYYSRLFMREFPQYSTFFDIRSSKADNSIPVIYLK